MTDIEAATEIFKVLSNLKSDRRRSAVLEVVAESIACAEDEKQEALLRDQAERLEVLKQEYSRSRKYEQ
jgi:hypothetical protein